MYESGGFWKKLSWFSLNNAPAFMRQDYGKSHGTSVRIASPQSRIHKHKVGVVHVSTCTCTHAK